MFLELYRCFFLKLELEGRQAHCLKLGENSKQKNYRKENQKTSGNSILSIVSVEMDRSGPLCDPSESVATNIRLTM